MRRLSMAQLGIAAGFLIICATLAVQKITTNFDKNFDFTRYAWGQNHIITRQGEQNDALIDPKVRQMNFRQCCHRLIIPSKNYVRRRRTILLFYLPERVGRSAGFHESAFPRRVPCAKTVTESDEFTPLGLALSEKQIPQITENTEKLEQ